MMNEAQKDTALKLIRFMRKFGSLKFVEMDAATPTEVDAILHIGLMASLKGFATPGAVADRMQISPSQLSQLLRSLDEHGFVARKRSTDDSRKVVLRLTDEGQKVFDQVEKAFSVQTDEIVEFLGKEESARFASTLRRLVEYMDERETQGGDAR